MSRVEHTYCRLCEVGCGLAVHVADDGRTIEKIRADHGHPVTEGYACSKGLLAADIHHDPDRVNHPLRRTGEGWRQASWDDALGDIATRVRAIVDRWGPKSVAMYLGNPSAFNAAGSMGSGVFNALIGSDRLFSAGSQDCNNKFAVGDLLYGAPMFHPIPDLEHTDHLLLLGSNVRVSRGSFASVADPVAKVAAIRKRGGTVRIVDPRRLEPSIADCVQIRPDTDVYLLAALLHEIDTRVGFDATASAHLTNLDALRAFLAQFPATRVAPVVGIDAEVIVAMAVEFATAPTACAHLSTGVNMGRQGALAYWLLQLLVLLTGNLDRRGGNIIGGRAIAAAPGDAAPFIDSPWGSYRPTSHMHPGALLADMITADEEPIRALFVVAGNPALSIGGGPRLAEAFADLDLLVCLDFYRNATGELAHWVLPTTDWFEREDLNTFVQGTQLDPFVQWTGPVVAPVEERRDEWRVFAELGRRAGLPPVFDPGGDPLQQMFGASLSVPLDELRGAERGVVRLTHPEPGGFLAGRTFDAVPPILVSTLARAEQLFTEMANEPPHQLKLISRRTSHTLNSALQNVVRLKERGAADNPLHMAPADAERLGLVDGDRVRVRNGYGELEACVAVDDTLRTGVVAMTHGFGNAQTAGMTVAQRHPGVNVNALAPSGPGTFDPISTMSHLTGVPVEVEPVLVG